MNSAIDYRKMLQADRANDDDEEEGGSGISGRVSKMAKQAAEEYGKRIAKEAAKKAAQKVFVSVIVPALPILLKIFLVFVLVIFIAVVLIWLTSFSTGSIADAEMKELRFLGIKTNSLLNTSMTGVQFNYD